MTRFRLFPGALAIAGLLALTSAVQAQSAAPEASPQDHQEHHPQAGPPPEAPAPGGSMMDVPQNMMAAMKDMDAKMDALLTGMNAATGDAKVESLAELVTAIVQQQRAMRGHMMQMHGRMMKSMDGPR